MSPSNLLPTATSTGSQQGNSIAVTAAAISQNQTMLSPYFPPLTNQPNSTQAMLRTTMQIRQMVSCQLSGQTVTMSATQASQRTTECSVPVIQPAAQTHDRTSPFVEDMMWVSNN